MKRFGILALAALTLMFGAVSMATAAQPAPKLRMIKVNGINMRVAEMGKGPLVILVHGWPESWYSWRNQIPAIAAAGYHVVAPDMRGYGGTDKPPNVEDYDIVHLTGDIVGIVDAMHEKKALLVGHDWGASVVWNSMLLHPDRFVGMAALSVPSGLRAPATVLPSERLKATYKDNFYYQLYFQEPGVAEKEFDADPRAILSRLYTSPDTPIDPPTVTDPKRAAGGWIPRLGAPKALPPWLSQKDLDYYVSQFKASGFRGGINYYRNFDRNMQITPQLVGAKINAPVRFLAGEKDIVIAGRNAEQLTATMKGVATDFRGVTLYPGAGHWVQQERAKEVNAALVDFINSVYKRG
jgi:pimeloyl-ACP methyl ester carboxylesterase